MKIICLPLALAAACLLPSALAQRDRPDDPFGQRRPGAVGERGPGPGFAALTQDERSAIRDILRDSREASRRPLEELRRARQALREAVTSEQPDEGAIRDRAGVIARLEGDLAMMRAKALVRLREKLPPAKAKRLESLLPALREQWGERNGGRAEAGQAMRRGLARPEARQQVGRQPGWQCPWGQDRVQRAPGWQPPRGRVSDGMRPQWRGMGRQGMGAQSMGGPGPGWQRPFMAGPRWQQGGGRWGMGPRGMGGRGPVGGGRAW